MSTMASRLLVMVRQVLAQYVAKKSELTLSLGTGARPWLHMDALDHSPLPPFQYMVDTDDAGTADGRSNQPSTKRQEVRL